MALDLHRIVCMVDFSALSRVGIRLGAELAGRCGASLAAFYGVNLPGDVVYGSDYSYSKPKQHRLLAEAKEKMRAFLQGHSDIDGRVVEGEPVEVLCRLVRQEAIDLVIVTARRMRGIRRWVSGNLIERLIRHIDCPVLVIGCDRNNGQDAFLSIPQIAAITLPDERHRPLMASAVQISRAFGAGLELLHVLEAPLDVESEPYETAQAHLEQGAAKQLQETAIQLGADPERIQTTILEGAPTTVLPAYFNECQSTMVIVGVRRSHPLKKNVIGSTTETVVRHYPRCILTYPIFDGDKPDHG
ncbi:universal stress protein [Desulfatirhabdium butyrativorans]|uniref:universal stress protein n=1 Tax=Desulfatirhabdium butyrativorans TaxID=340467 RepID=UPI0003F75038|nr:universal stress protein [Desulfatirhabdium butyrativorans]